MALTTGRSVALIRGVGGSTAMKMADLRAALVDAGLIGVATLQVAGNVVFDHTASAPADPAVLVRAAVRDRFGHDLAVIVRSHAELVDSLARHPYLDLAAGSRVSIAFLDSAPTHASIASLDRSRFTDESVTVDGREVFMCHPDGQANSKLTLPWLERQLGVIGTARNVNTVVKLIAMTADGATTGGGPGM